MPIRHCANPDCAKMLTVLNPGPLCYSCGDAARAAAFRQKTKKTAPRPSALSRALSSPHPAVPSRIRHGTALERVLAAVESGANTSAAVSEFTRIPRGACSSYLSMLEKRGKVARTIVGGDRFIDWEVRDPEACQITVPADSLLSQQIDELSEGTNEGTNEAEEMRMDVLQAKVIKVEEIPDAAVPARKFSGRLGELRAQLLALAPGFALEVKNRNNAHCTYTLRNIKKRVVSEGFDLLDRRVGTTLYLHWKKRGGDEK